ncbi:MAG: peptidoglycan recognition family protein [Acidimicrobiia bacterium]|nr:peptidoglycan recognition family protein [Acidimicrobiia bacterium]
MEPITRRRFLLMTAAGLGGFALWQRRPDDPVPTAAPVSTTVTTSGPLPTTTTMPATTTTTRPPVALEVIGREGWGARPPVAEYGTHTIDHLTVHHTSVILTDNRLAPARLRGHQAYHQEQGWADLAYHFAIDRDGNVYEARPYSAPGDTFTNYDPAGHFLPVLEGNYSEQEPTDRQLESLVLLLAWASAEFGVDPATIGGHRDYAATTCPGDRLYASIGDGSIGRRVQERLDSGGVALTYALGEAALARVAGIEA